MSLLPPPAGVYLPPQLIFHPGLTAASLLTWVRLRSLAPDGWETPPLSLPVLAAQLGLHPARLARHLARLQELGALGWRDEGSGVVTLCFPEEPILLPIPYHALESDPSPTPARLPSIEHGTPASYFPSRILGYISYDDENDPLYLDLDQDLSGSAGPQPLGEFSRLPIRKPAEHTFVGK